MDIFSSLSCWCRPPLLWRHDKVIEDNLLRFNFVIWNKRIVSNSIQSTVSIIPSTFWSFRGLHEQRWVDAMRFLPWWGTGAETHLLTHSLLENLNREGCQSSCQEGSDQSLGETDVSAQCSDKLGSLKCLGESYSLSFASQPWVSWWNHHHQSLQL